MTKKILWLTAAISISLYLLFWHHYVKPLTGNDEFIPYETVITTLLTILLMGTAFTPIAAIIPFRSYKYKTRLSVLLPASFTFMCLLFGLGFFITGPHYHSIEQDTNLDCSCVKNGTFLYRDSKIEREDLHQTETNIKTGEKAEFSLVWLSDCEYKLLFGKKAVSVKIVYADCNGYSCYILNDGRTSKKVKIIKINPKKQS